MSLLAYAAIFLAATVIAVPLCRRLGLGSVLGYLLAGIVLGPWGMRLIQDGENILHFAEFGVVMLLFVIGLELQPTRLRAMRKAVFGLGLTQVLVTTLIFGAIGWLCGLAPDAALVVGFALSLSSTPLVLQLLAERHELNTQHGRASFGVLLFQDIAVMPMLAVMPLLAHSRVAQSLQDTLLATGKAIAVLLLFVFGGRYLLRPVLRIVAETRSKEAFTAAALLVVIGVSLLFHAVDLSMALGAFVAGVLLAESEYRHELEADIDPFKGLLLGLFFVSVGMTANLGALLDHPLRIAGLVLALIGLKFALAWIIGRLSGHSSAESRGMAFSLAQAGEFGFVLFSLGVSEGLIDQSLADTLVIVVTISMIASPLLMMLLSAIEPRMQKTGVRDFDRIESDNSQVIVAGFGRFGQIIGRVLRMRRIRFTALESDVAQVDFVRRFGNKVYYGDASRRDVLAAAGAARAEVLVLAMDDIDLSVRTAEIVRKHFPHLKLLARARNRQHAIRLMDLGVRYVVRETYLSSLDMARHALEALGMPHAEAVESIERFDKHDQRALQLQRDARDDEQKLIQSAQQAARELEQLFEQDTMGDTQKQAGTQ
ncbi:MAG TPA: monovalent cation:proton antiporter-2 (CPA2) family protein [Povalibacter sp.]|uniref:monovalent cation:proton antiporter-2 (CPA2) family protein n=1 Tax=Povalibacter sp. TaxID=1962978 RepID=UPI002B75AB48|nr:monovalent cation:proton antiporter-2 (CPA2) family protein [Povalibacter sp.]HMN45163.1 monovalent cation:proton antiporter-2 (CPA2) family protein [Povalibacter sp.]